MFDFVTVHLFDRLLGSFLFRWQVGSAFSKFGSTIDPHGREANTDNPGEPGGAPLEIGSTIDPYG